MAGGGTPAPGVCSMHGMVLLLISFFFPVHSISGPSYLKYYNCARFSPSIYTLHSPWILPIIITTDLEKKLFIPLIIKHSFRLDIPLAGQPCCMDSTHIYPGCAGQATPLMTVHKKDQESWGQSPALQHPSCRLSGHPSCVPCDLT